MPKAADPTTRYAQRVADGKIIAGPHVRAACKRHLEDLKTGKKRGISFDKAAAGRAFWFFENILRLNGGEHEGKPFKLHESQEFIVGSIFGWKNADGNRRFRVAFVEIAKGSGKSPLAAGIGLYMMTADGEARAECYAAAVDRGQATIAFRDAVAMVDQSPALSDRITKSGGPGREFNLAFIKTGSFFRPISSEARGRGKSGPRPHFALLDEVHEHPTNAMVEFMRAGTKGRAQPLILMITNSGYDQNSVCYQWHKYAVDIVQGSQQNDAVFSFVCGLDEGDDWRDESCWTKANPLLGVTIPHSYLREQVNEAIGMPSKQSIVRRLNFCEWVGSAEMFIPPEVWLSLEGKHDESDLDGQICFGGLDLSWSRDLSSLELLFPDIDGTERVLSYFWLPEDGIHDRAQLDGVPYVDWHQMGHLRLTPGAAIDLEFVADDIIKICERFDVRGIAYDRARIKNLLSEFDKLGVPVVQWDGEEPCFEPGLRLVPWGQGFVSMAPAIDALENSVVSGKFRHAGNPVLTWNNGNVALESDPAGNRKFNKRRSIGRIDGMVALGMAFGLQAKLPTGIADLSTDQIFAAL